MKFILNAKKNALLIILAAALSVIACGGGGSDGGTPAPQDNFGVILTKATADDAASANGLVTEMDPAETFWTPERIKKAMENPLDPTVETAVRQTGSVSSQKTEKFTPSTDGTPKSSAPFNPDGISRKFPALKDSGFVSGAVSSRECPASDYETGYYPQYWQYPESTVGMLAIRKGNVLVGVCSASLVGKNMIMTAAHCVADEGEWYSDWAFVPGFNDSGNMAPYGIGYAKYAFLYSGWLNDEYRPADVAFIVLKQSLGDQTGYLGFTVNQAKEQTWLQLGYPVSSSYEPGILAYNISSYGYDECTLGTPCPIAVGSLLTKGSSGGPWLLTGYYTNGLNSAKPTACYSSTMLSPYFGDKIWDLFQLAKTYQ